MTVQAMFTSYLYKKVYFYQNNRDIYSLKYCLGFLCMSNNLSTYIFFLFIHNKNI